MSKGQTTVKPLYYERQSLFGSQNALSLMNKPITERRGSLDMLFSRRLSTGFGNSNFNTFYNPTHEVANEMGKGFFSSSEIKKKRKPSNMVAFGGQINDFEEHHLAQQRRLSLMSTFSDFDEYMGLDQNPTRRSQTRVGEIRLNPNLSAETVRKNLEAFAFAMEKSRKSQQDIHDWDRKMGLKRSHSKTMRMTMRSRKKLKAMLKKDINTLC